MTTLMYPIGYSVNSKNAPDVNNLERDFCAVIWYYVLVSIGKNQIFGFFSGSNCIIEA